MGVQGVFSSEVISFPKLMRANCRIPIFVRLIFGTGLLKVVKIHFRFSFQSVQLSTIFIWNTDDSVQDLGAYLMNWVALYFNLSNWGPFSRKNNYEIAKSFCKMKVYLLFSTLWRAYFSNYQWCLFSERLLERWSKWILYFIEMWTYKFWLKCFSFLRQYRFKIHYEKKSTKMV